MNITAFFYSLAFAVAIMFSQKILTGGWLLLLCLLLPFVFGLLVLLVFERQRWQRMLRELKDVFDIKAVKKNFKIQENLDDPEIFQRHDHQIRRGVVKQMVKIARELDQELKKNGKLIDKTYQREDREMRFKQLVLTQLEDDRIRLRREWKKAWKAANNFWILPRTMSKYVDGKVH